MTTCGNIPSTWFDGTGILATFTFLFRGGRLSISKSGKRKVVAGQRSPSGAGCGKTIEWSAMAPVQVPPEFCQTAQV